MSTLQVENLIGPTSGSNANKVIIPSGQTLHAPGHVINQEMLTTTTEASVTSTTLTSVWTPTYTPVSNNSFVFATFNMNMRMYNNSGPDGRSKMRIKINGTDVSFTDSLGTYDYGNSGAWSKMYYTYFTKYTNTSTSTINYDFLMAQHGAMGVRIGEGGAESQVTFTEIAQ
ncbi:hypothetical protein N9014_00380 [bacterium]|nr:hypothetical protein [bacterium]